MTKEQKALNKASEVNSLIFEFISGCDNPTEKIESCLYEICSSFHGFCNKSDCPVKAINGGEAPDHPPKFDSHHHYGCDTFMDGKDMFYFIKNKLK